MTQRKISLSTSLCSAFAALALATTGTASAQMPQLSAQTRVIAPGPITPTTPLPPPVPFRKLTNNLNEVANFNVETTRGMVLWNGNAELWALNTHGSTLNKFVGVATEPVAKYPTLVNPIAIRLWEDNLLVLGSATKALALHDRTTGKILSCVMVDSEPFDMVVDEDNDTAYISCQGSDTLVEVDLNQMRVTARIKLDVERPGFLTFMTNNPLNHKDNEVWVTPEVSGNNTMAFGSINVAVILDGTDQSLFVEGLPDIDLLSVNTFTHDIVERGRSIHTIGMGHGLNPVTGEYWHLGVDSHNEQFNSEPEANGVFQDNTLSVTEKPFAGPFPKMADRTLDLEVIDSEVGGNPKTVSMPWDVHFDQATGFAWVSSSTGDLIATFNPDGTRRTPLDIQLPDGSIPRQIIQDATGTLLLVYCWGTNEIQVISLLAETFNQIILTLNLGHDPFPEQVQAGREIFYDADNSNNDSVTCGSCHPGGGADSLAWNIQDLPVDSKGVMITQTLFGIADSFPHHWRGERSLEDFNVAFPGLLGGTLLDTAPGSEQDQFGAFVNGLTSYANPNVHISRKVHDIMTLEPLEDGTIGSAVAGEFVFNEVSSDGQGACVACHFLPTGSSGDTIPEIGSQIAELTHPEITQNDNTVELKDQRVVDVELSANVGGGTFPFQLLGSGWAHNGTVRSLLGFLQIFGALTPEQQSDCTAFMKQFDSGTAPSVHACYQLNQFSAGHTAKRIRNILLAQSIQGWCGTIAFGTSTHRGVVHEASWYFDPTILMFIPDDPALDPVKPSFFADQAPSGLCDMVFMGTAPGNEIRLGVDYDNDGLINGDEALLGTDAYVADSDLDGWEDGYEVEHGSDPADELSTPTDNMGPNIMTASEDFTVANVSKWHLEFDEKTRYEFTFQTPGGKVWEQRGEEFSKSQTVVFQHREASTLPLGTPNSFMISAKLFDLSGNMTTIPNFGSFLADSMLNDGTFTQVLIGDIDITSQSVSAPGTMDLTTELRIDFKEFAPPASPAPDFVVIGQVLVRDTTTGNWEISPNVTYAGPTDFIWDSTNVPPVDLYAAQPGPWVVFDKTSATGLTSANVQISGLTAGQEVMMNVKLIHPAPLGWVFPAIPPFEGGSAAFWDKPMTLPENRNVVTTF